MCRFTYLEELSLASLNVSFHCSLEKWKLWTHQTRRFLNVLSWHSKVSNCKKKLKLHRESIVCAMKKEEMLFWQLFSIVPEQVWVCYGEQNYGKVCYVNCEDSVVMDLGIEVQTRTKLACPAARFALTVNLFRLWVESRLLQEDTKFLILKLTPFFILLLSFIQVHSRIMCMCCVGDDIILLGTLSWGIYAYSTSTR